MAMYKAYGAELVDHQTVMEMAVRGELHNFERSMQEKRAMDAMLELAGERVPFEEIGINKPLTVEIRHVYTGRFPRGLFGLNNGLLVTSAMKSVAMFGAAPRAVNFMRTRTERNSDLRMVAATEDGTPLVFYTPALTETTCVITIELVFDEFPMALVEGIGTALRSSGGIPVFAQYGPILVAAGTAVNIAGRLAEKLVDGRPVFSVTETIGYLRPGDNAPQEGFHLLAEDDFDIQGAGCVFDDINGRLVYRASDRPYDGPHPYVVISLDGRSNNSYSDFLPTAASAALLDRFYHIGAGQEQTLDILLDAVKLYNDWQYRQRADALLDRLEKAKAEHGEESREYRELKVWYDANVTNILNAALRPGT